MAEPAIIEKIEQLKTKFHGKKVIIGVDRLDYIKGVPQKLLAFEQLLTKYPQYKNSVIIFFISFSFIVLYFKKGGLDTSGCSYKIKCTRI